MIDDLFPGAIAAVSSISMISPDPDSNDGSAGHVVRGLL